MPSNTEQSLWKTKDERGDPGSPKKKETFVPISHPIQSCKTMSGTFTVPLWDFSLDMKNNTVLFVFVSENILLHWAARM